MESRAVRPVVVRGLLHVLWGCLDFFLGLVVSRETVLGSMVVLQSTRGSLGDLARGRECS